MYLYLLNNKKPMNIHGLYVIYIELFFLGQIFHSISILLNKNIHITGIHTLRIQLIFTVNKHRRNTTQLHVSCGFFLLSDQRFHHEAVPRRVVLFTFNTCVDKYIADIRC